MVNVYTIFNFLISNRRLKSLAPKLSLLNKIISLLAIITILSCKNKDSNKNIVSEELHSKVKAVDINFENEDSIYEEEFTNIIKDFEFLPLIGHPKEDYFASIDKVIEHENLYYVLDKKKSNILVFNKSGEFVFKVGKRGGGPEEYGSIVDFDIDKKRKELLILDEGIVLMVYNTQGAFIRQNELFGFYPRTISLIDSGVLASGVGYIEPGAHSLMITGSENGEVLGQLAKYPDNFKDEQGYAFTGGINRSESGTYYTFRSSSLIYKVNSDLTMTPAYNFLIDGQTWPTEKKFELKEFDRAISNHEASYLTNDYYVSPNILAFAYKVERQLRQAYYFKESNKLYIPNSELDKRILRFFSVPSGQNKNGKYISGLLYEKYQFYNKDNEYLTEGLKAIDKSFGETLESMNYENNSMLVFYNLEEN